MNDAVLHVLLILAYLAIGLVSVTFPIYAISVNFLPQQKWESEKERDKRKNELLAKISAMSVELKGGTHDTEQVTQLQEQLDKYKAELEGTELRYQYLTASGAVGIPVALLVSALLCAGAGIAVLYSDLQDPQNTAIVLGGVSAFFCAVALGRLYKTISAVEYGALRPERTIDFEVGFGNEYEKTTKMELNKQTRTALNVRTEECDITNLYFHVEFPSELEMESYESPIILITKHEACTIMRFTQDYLPKGIGTGVEFTANPRKAGKYPVHISICAKGIYRVKKELTVKVA